MEEDKKPERPTSAHSSDKETVSGIFSLKHRVAGFGTFKLTHVRRRRTASKMPLRLPLAPNHKQSAHSHDRGPS